MCLGLFYAMGKYCYTKIHVYWLGSECFLESSKPSWTIAWFVCQIIAILFFQAEVFLSGSFGQAVNLSFGHVSIYSSVSCGCRGVWSIVYPPHVDYKLGEFPNFLLYLDMCQGQWPIQHRELVFKRLPNKVITLYPLGPVYPFLLFFKVNL